MHALGALGAVAIALGAGACSPSGKPTQLSVPEGAVEVRQVTFAGGRAHQTDFTLKVAYPDDRALHHYIKAIPSPWIRCEWAPTWDSHLDGTQAPVHTVHQQLHMWVNRDAQRALLVSMRYYSASDCAPKPLNDDQKVVVVEYMGVDVDDQISTLQLKCPERHCATRVAHEQALRSAEGEKEFEIQNRYRAIGAQLARERRLSHFAYLAHRI